MKKFLELMLSMSVIVLFTLIGISCSKSNNDTVDEEQVENQPSDGNESSESETGSNKYIDLGLSVYWARCNVNAENEYQLGSAFAYGETKEKNYYNSSNYKAPSTWAIAGTNNDPANMLLGDGWRLPTEEEMIELCKECDWNISNYMIKGEVVGGAYITGPNGNKIFLPLGGDVTQKIEPTQYGDSYMGYYWYENKADKCCLYFDFSGYSYKILVEAYKGLLVRPVKEKPITISTGEAIDVTDYSVTLSGCVSHTIKTLTCGIIYGTDRNLTETSGDMVSTTSTGEYSIKVTSLDYNTTYYYRAYAIVNGQFVYGEIKSFTTEAKSTYKIGEAYPNEDKAEGVVFYVDKTGKHGKIVSLDYTGPTAWGSPTIFVPNCSDLSDGSKNKMPSNTSSLAKWCYNHGTGWYCPAKTEVAAIANNLAAMNNTLVRVGNKLPEGIYWSSTQYYTYTDLAYVVCVAEDNYSGYKPAWSSYNTKSEKRYGCAAKKF